MEGIIMKIEPGLKKAIKKAIKKVIKKPKRKPPSPVLTLRQIKEAQARAIAVVNLDTCIQYPSAKAAGLNMCIIRGVIEKQCIDNRERIINKQGIIRMARCNFIFASDIKLV
jgi:hypothetical protein